MALCASAAVWGRAAAGLTALVMAGCAALARAQEQPPAAQAPDHSCTVDLHVAGQMKDIVSNALTRGLDRPEAGVQAFLDGAESRYATGPELLTASAAHFGIAETALRAEVERFKHVNCGAGALGAGDALAADKGHGQFDGTEAPAAAWAFARNVTLHVVLHEIGHGLIREFDLPVLGNEETMADAFATHYLVMHMPDRAVDVLTARVTSLMIEAREGTVSGWGGEHDHDGRRAFQIAALAVAADAQKYAPVAAAAGLSADDIEEAVDYGSEIHRSWRRVLGPLWMPEGAVSGEARVRSDESPFVRRLCEGGLSAEVERALGRFDWHSMVTVALVDQKGGAGWSRGTRTVTVSSGYMNRFVVQGTKAIAAGK